MIVDVNEYECVYSVLPTGGAAKPEGLAVALTAACLILHLVQSMNMLNQYAKNAARLTVKLLFTFLVLDSATLASVRSTSSKMIDCKERMAGKKISYFKRPAKTYIFSTSQHLQSVMCHSVSHLSCLSVVQSPPSQFEVSSLPPLERVGLFHKVALLQHRLTHRHTNYMVISSWIGCKTKLYQNKDRALKLNCDHKNPKILT